jgi:glycosyltransferase involved in cell wall biosynthesis
VKVALVHDWMNGMRGGEKILEVLAEIFPDADIYTLLYEPEKISPVINKHKVYVSFLQKMPFVKRFYRYYLPLFPFAIERFELRGYDIVISTSHCVAKGIKVSDNALHICYCLTPMRYVWDFSGEYFSFMRFIFKPILSYLKAWDKKTSSRPNFYLTISHTVADRVKRYYNKDSVIIYPPVDTKFFVPQDIDEDYYLIVSALVPYKRIDLAVKAFTKLGYPLVVIGSGTDYKKLKEKAGNNIQFIGWQSDNVVRNHYARCKALIFPGIEDFGITVLEAQSCGRPVIAYYAGGAKETIDLNMPTGVFFKEQDVDELIRAVKDFEKNKKLFNKQKIREHVLSYDRELFKERLKDEIQRIFNLYYNSQNSK